MIKPASGKPGAVHIIECEVSGQAVYMKRYAHPTWPGGGSGVTIGIGCDLGHTNADALTADWGNFLPVASILDLVGVIGPTGLGARGDGGPCRRTLAYRPFRVHRIDPAELRPSDRQGVSPIGGGPPECFGALVSLVYNRGTSMIGDGRREMEAMLWERGLFG